MEPISFTAIVAFLGYKAAEQVVSGAVSDAYESLKDKLSSQFGGDSEVIEAVNMLEKRPDSEARKEVLQEEVERTAVDQDLEVRQAAQRLLEQIEFQPGGEQHIQYARGSYIAQADRGSTATVNVERSEELPEE